MIAVTGAEHHRFEPVLALFGLVKTAAKRRRGLGTMSPSGFGRQPNVPPVSSIAKRKKARIRKRSET